MKTKSALSLFLLIGLTPGVNTFAQGTPSVPLPPPGPISYQGRLTSNGVPLNGQYELQVRLLNTNQNTPWGPTLTNVVPVVDGIFSTLLNFGSNVLTLDPDPRSLVVEIGIRPNGIAQPFTLLDPPQPLTAVPIAVAADVARSASSVASNSVRADAIQSGAVTGGHIAIGQVVKSLNGLTDHMNLIAGPNISITPSGNGFRLSATGGGAATNAWLLGGNPGTLAGPNFVGTTDNQPLELKVNNSRAWRLEPNATSPNVIGGASVNTVDVGVAGATIGGGGFGGVISGPNRISASHGSIGGGSNNRIFNGASYATIAGGSAARIHTNGAFSIIGGGTGNGIYDAAEYAAIGGGYLNTILTNADSATISGGSENVIDANAAYAAIGGGSDNTAGGVYSTVSGGRNNRALAGYSAVGGGFTNVVEANALYSTINGGRDNRIQSSVQYATVAGGRLNECGAHYTFAAGRNAKALHYGSFVWNNDPNATFGSTADSQFLVRAGGGVGINTNSPRAALHVNGNAQVDGTVTVKVLTITGGADVAEPFAVSGDEIPPGAVVVIDESNPGRLKLSQRAYDTRVAGIISGANDVRPGLSLCQQGVLEGGRNVALTGRVYALADASKHPIEAGDLLTTSDIPGRAMKAQDPARAHGAVLGKAMTSLKDGQGLVLVLVSLQ